MNKAMNLAFESAFAPQLFDRLRRATKAMALNNKIRLGQATIIRNLQKERDKLRAENDQLRKERAEAMERSIVRGRELEIEKKHLQSMRQSRDQWKESFYLLQMQVRESANRRRRLARKKARKK